MQNDSQLATVLADNIACALEKQQYRFGDIQNGLAATSLEAEALGLIVPGAGLVGEAAAIGSDRRFRRKNCSRAGASASACSTMPATTSIRLRSPGGFSLQVSQSLFPGSCCPTALPTSIARLAKTGRAPLLFHRSPDCLARLLRRPSHLANMRRPRPAAAADHSGPLIRAPAYSSSVASPPIDHVNAVEKAHRHPSVPNLRRADATPFVSSAAGASPNSHLHDSARNILFLKFADRFASLGA